MNKCAITAAAVRFPKKRKNIWPKYFNKIKIQKAAKEKKSCSTALMGKLKPFTK